MYCLLQLSLHQVWIISNKKTIIPYNEYHCYIQRSITVLEKCCSNLYWAFFQYHHTNFSKAYKLCLTLCHSHYPVLVRILTTIAHLMDYPPPTLDLDNFWENKLHMLLKITHERMSLEFFFWKESWFQSFSVSLYNALKMLWRPSWYSFFLKTINGF